MIYKNKTFNVPSIEEIIRSLIDLDIDIILIGSEAGQLYHLCESKKDIDFMLNTSQENMIKFYNYLRVYFPLKNYDEFINLSRIMILTSDQKPIEFVQKSNFIDFDNIQKNCGYANFYNTRVKVISLEDYISYITKFIEYLENNADYNEKYHKYKKIIHNYEMSQLP